MEVDQDMDLGGQEVTVGGSVGREIYIGGEMGLVLINY